LDPLFEELKDEYHNGRLILFVGAGVSAAAGLPSWGQLVEILFERAQARNAEPQVLADVAELMAKQSYIDALTALKDSLGAAEFCSVVERRLDDRLVEEPLVARAIAALAPKLRAVLTTNLDHLLERAFGGKWPTLPRATGDLASREKYILKLHGTLLERDSWVLTREQYDRAMWADAKLAQAFTALFHTHALLFVGYGLADDDFDAILGRVRAFAGEQPPRHYALVAGSGVTSSKRRRVQGAGVRVLTYPNADGNHAELVGLLEGLLKPPAAVSRSSGSLPPTPRVEQSSVSEAPPPISITARSSPAPTLPISLAPPSSLPPSVLPAAPQSSESFPPSARSEVDSTRSPASKTPTATTRRSSRVNTWLIALASAAVAAGSVLAFDGLRARATPAPRTLKVGMTFFPVAANEDHDNPLVKLLNDSMKCEATNAEAPIDVHTEFGSSYDKLVAGLLSGDYAFAIVPPFTFLQCLQGQVPDYAAGRCLDLKLTPAQSALLPECHVLGQRLRSASGMSQLELQSYRPVLVANVQHQDLLIRKEVAALSGDSDRFGEDAVNWEALHGKRVLLGNPLSTSSNLIPRILLAEHGINDVVFEPGNDRAKAIEALRGDDQGEAVAFMADDDFQRGPLASHVRVILLDRHIPFDPIVTCGERPADDVQTRVRVLEKMQRIGLVRLTSNWSYPAFVRYIYTAPVGEVSVPGRPATFTLPQAFADRRGLRTKLHAGQQAKVIRFDVDNPGAEDVISEHTLGMTKIEKVEGDDGKEIKGDRGEVNLSADMTRECAKAHGACHLDSEH
jgi:ABC-type phosphate/phosphonate transport system substrate-binding protein